MDSESPLEVLHGFLETPCPPIHKPETVGAPRQRSARRSLGALKQRDGAFKMPRRRAVVAFDALRFP